ncbi:MAG: hypothetical protein GVY16_06260 [Planctomycetes bacterium]|jgi:hypothetical protein|nr:hypothetical protein [Phycisphaerae bacterium]NBB95327.1 hypothetical protein [Planctomycetota bacterium]
MAANDSSVQLPIEVVDKGAAWVAVIEMVFGALIGGLLIVAFVADSIAQGGMGGTWWLLLLGIPGYALFLAGLYLLRARKIYVISATEVLARMRAFRAWREWREPTAEYEAVTITTQAILAADGTATGTVMQTVTLAHSDPEKCVELAKHSQIAHTDTHAYARAVAAELGLELQSDQDEP